MDYWKFCYFLFNIYLISSCQLWSCFFIIFWQKFLAERLLNFHQRKVIVVFESAWCLQRCSENALSYFHDNLLIKKCILYKSLLEVDIVNDIFYFVLMWHKFMQFLLFVYFFMKKSESKCIIFWIKWFIAWNN